MLNKEIKNAYENFINSCKEKTNKEIIVNYSDLENFYRECKKDANKTNENKELYYDVAYAINFGISDHNEISIYMLRDIKESYENLIKD